MRVAHKKFILIAVVCAVFLYGLFQARNFLLGPQIRLESPAQGAILKDALVVVRGHADDVSRLSFNGRQIFTDADGNFSEEYILAPGINEIRIDGEDKFGKHTSISRTVSLE